MQFPATQAPLQHGAPFGSQVSSTHAVPDELDELDELDEDGPSVQITSPPGP